MQPRGEDFLLPSSRLRTEGFTPQVRHHWEYWGPDCLCHGPKAEALGEGEDLWLLLSPSTERPAPNTSVTQREACHCSPPSSRVLDQRFCQEGTGGCKTDSSSSLPKRNGFICNRGEEVRASRCSQKQWRMWGKTTRRRLVESLHMEVKL